MSVWLFMQGDHANSLPPRVTWYPHDREFIGRTDHYTLNLYRGKGYVLDKTFLDQGMLNVQVRPHPRGVQGTHKALFHRHLNTKTT